MLATFYDFTFIKDADFVRILDGGKPMCDGNGGTCLHQAFQSLLNQAFAFRIESGSRFVKD